MESLNFDTTFLIDLQRERRNGEGPAHRFLRDRPTAIPCLSLVAYGEYAEGFDRPDHPHCLLMLDSFQLLPFDRETAVRYSRISLEFRASGNRIGANDLWIAAVSLANELPLVTRTVVEFQRVPGLRVLAY